MIPALVVLEDGTEVAVTADAFGYLARHDGVTYHLTATATGRSLTPAK